MKKLLWIVPFLFMATRAFALGDLPPDPPPPPEECAFEQVNQDGFMSPNTNYYAWALAEFQDPATNTTYLYASTHNWEGGEIWRTPVPIASVDSWEQVLDVSPAGGNTGFRNLAVFNEMIFAGSRNDSGGCQLWRSDIHGENFEMAVGGGFGNPNMESVRGLQVFENYLYIGLQESLLGAGTGQLWRTADGYNFERVTLPDAMGGAASGNSSMHTMAVHGGLLYIATKNINGGFQIWSWDGDTYFPAPDDDVAAFSPIVGPGGPIMPGFGDSSESIPLDIHVHNNDLKDYLFVGTSKPGGFSVFRINLNDYNDWEQLASGGLGDRFAYYAWRFASFGNVWDGNDTKYLWFGTYNYLPTFWPSSSRAGALYRSADNGENWELMIGDGGYCGIGYGFDDRQNWGIRSFAVIGEIMYIGTAACLMGGCSSYQGAEIWTLEDWTLP